MEVETAIPAAVRKQGEDAEALHRRLYPDQYPKTGGEQTGKEPAPAKPGEEKETPAAKPPEIPKPNEGKPEPTAEEWKQKYETLQGKYNAEVPQLHAITAGLRNQLQETLARVKTLEDEKATAPNKEPEKTNGSGEEEITDPTLKTFSEEYPDIFEAVKKMMGKPAEAAKPASAKPAEPAAPASDARGTMLYYLTRDVPNWREINRNPEFIQSLGSPDPRTGMDKMQSLNLAWNANDFTTVIGYFRDFKPGTPTPPAPPAPAGEPELTEEQKALAPPKGGRPPGPVSEDQNTITPQDLAKFYDDARKGYWGPITEDRYRKEEARLLAALMKAKK